MTSEPHDPPSGEYDRHESEPERLDRNLGELLQELRVAQTGVQILFAFLLSIAFQQRFAEVDAVGRAMYVVALVCSLLSSGFLIGPVGYHRLVFRRAMKAEVVSVANRFALIGLAWLSVSLGAGLTLILDLLYSKTVAVVGGCAALVFLAVLWFLVPWLRLRAKRGDGPDL